jgi:hypothetical protein
MTADTEPIEILLHLPLLCEEKVRSFSRVGSLIFTSLADRTYHTSLYLQRSPSDVHVTFQDL